ncbi:MAG: ketoacyl-ACP synthase III [Actinobacteria bacterium]|nr:MAG: ketoacyl-ACP synthase III [Actinomycetota bacterium]
MRGAAVTGWGAALPETVVTNADLEARLDTTDEWIVERTGIRERRVGGTTSSLATEAAAQALDRAALRPSDIDLLLLATTTPDQAVPATSPEVAHRLGLTCGAMDLNAACSGFVYALVAAAGMVGLGVDRVLVIGAETLSRIVDQDDRTTAVIFADAAGAVVLEAVPGETKLLGYDLGADGSLRSLLYCDHGGFIVMEGQELFRRAVRATVESARAALERAKVTAEEITLFVPHQANLRIIDAAGQRLGLPRERTALVLDRTGNTSAASVPVALADAVDDGRLSPGDLVLLSGFGAGMTWASAVLRWGR